MYFCAQMSLTQIFQLRLTFVDEFEISPAKAFPEQLLDQNHVFVLGMANLLEQKEDEEAIASLECKWEVDVTTGEITTHSSAVSMTEKMLHRCDYEKARAAYYDAQFDIKSLTQNSKKY